MCAAVTRLSGSASPFFFSLVANFSNVSRYNHHLHPALLLLLGHLPPTRRICVVISECMYLYIGIPAPCMHAVRVLLFLRVYAGTFCRTRFYIYHV
jgi:hypothetical protein